MTGFLFVLQRFASNRKNCEKRFDVVRKICESLTHNEMKFSDIIKAKREKLGMTQTEMAAAIGVSPRTLWDWESGEEPDELKKVGVLSLLRKLKK